MKRSTSRPPRSVLAAVERLLSNEWTAFFCFVLLLLSLHLTTWQALLAIVVYVHLGTEPAEWIKQERAAHRVDGEG